MQPAASLHYAISRSIFHRAYVYHFISNQEHAVSLPLLHSISAHRSVVYVISPMTASSNSIMYVCVYATAVSPCYSLGSSVFTTCRQPFQPLFYTISSAISSLSYVCCLVSYDFQSILGPCLYLGGILALCSVYVCNLQPLSTMLYLGPSFRPTYYSHVCIYSFMGKLQPTSGNEVKIYDESELCVTWGKSTFKVSHCRGLYHWTLVFDSCYVYGVCVCNLRPLSTMIY
jgi:hypothetical protein